MYGVKLPYLQEVCPLFMRYGHLIFCSLILRHTAQVDAFEKTENSKKKKKKKKK